MENLKMGSKSLLLMLKNIHDSHGTVSNSFGPYLRDLLLKIWEIYEKCSNSVNFWARKMFFFFKWVRISPEIDWYHYQGASPAPMCIVRHQKLIKVPTSEVSHQSPVWGGVSEPKCWHCWGWGVGWGVSDQMLTLLILGSGGMEKLGLRAEIKKTFYK